MKQYSLRPLVSVALLVSTLLMLSGCMDWFKGKGACPTCEPGAKLEGTYGAEAGAPGEVLLTIRSKPVITQGSFEEYWQELLKSDPNLESMLPFMPNARQEVFKNAVMEKVIQEWVHASGKDKDPDFQKKLAKQRALADRMVAIQAFQEDLLKGVDTSDAALEKFYNENRDKNSVFQQPPFLQSPKGLKVQAVQFGDEKQAKDFLAKAQAAGANFTSLAKAAKKDVKDLGTVSAQSRNADFAVKAKVKDMKPGELAVVSTGNKQFMVLKTGQEQEAKYAPFAEVKDAVKQAKTQVEFGDKFTNRIEELKKEYGAVESTQFFDKEKEKQTADLQTKLKDLQEQQPAGEKEVPAEAAPAAPAPQAATAA
jgi:hypothetical protein